MLIPEIYVGSDHLPDIVVPMLRPIRTTLTLYIMEGLGGTCSS
jgi:hypothetical protein